VAIRKIVSDIPEFTTILKKNVRSLIKKIYKTLLYYGFNAKTFLDAIIKTRTNWFYVDFEELKRQKGTDDTFDIVSIVLTP